MLKRTFTYIGTDGSEHKDTWYFNLTKADLLKLNMGSFGGLEDLMKRLVREDKPKEIVDMFESLILGSVGEKSPDGRRFIRSAEISEDFHQTEAYSQLFCELVQDAKKLQEFVLAIVPDDVRSAVQAQEEAKAKLEQAEEKAVAAE